MSTQTKHCNVPAVVHIYSHTGHRHHNEQHLVDAVVKGDPLAIRKFWLRINPFIEVFASDRMWEDYEAALRRGREIIERGGFECLKSWNSGKRSLTQHVDRILREELRRELLRRRDSAKNDPLVLAAIEESVDNLPSGQYWLLRKLIKDRVSRKRVMTMLNECPEIRIQSFSSLGTTYSRALGRLHRVCPEKYRRAVGEFIHTRQRSGRYR